VWSTGDNLYACSRGDFFESRRVVVNHLLRETGAFDDTVVEQLMQHHPSADRARAIQAKLAHIGEVEPHFG